MCAKNWTDADIENFLIQEPAGAELEARQEAAGQIDEFLKILNTPFFVEYRKKWHQDKEDKLKPYLLKAKEQLKNEKALNYEEFNLAPLEKLFRLYFFNGDEPRKLEYIIAKGKEYYASKNPSQKDIYIAALVLKRALENKRAAEKRERAASAREAQKSALDKLRAADEISNAVKYHYNTKDPTITFATDVFARQGYSYETDEASKLTIRNGLIWAKAYVDKENDVYFLIKATPDIIKLDLLGYDFFLAGVLDQLYLEGKKEVSVSMILKRMNIKQNDATRDKLISHLKLGAAVYVDIDNAQVVKKWGKDKAGLKVAGPMYFIQIKEETAIINGKVTSATVKIGGFSPFYQQGISFLGQAQEWSEQLLQLYTGSKTDDYWRVMRYLIREIAYMMKGRRNNHLLMSSIYEYVEVNTTDRHKKIRIRKITYQILKECFAACGYIALNVKDKDGKPTLDIDEVSGDVFIKLTRAPQKAIEAGNQ